MLEKDAFLQLLLISIAGGFTATILFWSLFFVISFKATKYRNFESITIILILAGSILGEILSLILFMSFWKNTLTQQILVFSVSTILTSIGMIIGLTASKRIEKIRGNQFTIDYKGRTCLVDTSAIIDGRIADLLDTGFIRYHFYIPTFILDELRHIADSSDPLRRTRGKRGLEVLVRLQKNNFVKTTILQAEIQGNEDVDRTLINLANKIGAAILTTDFNLNRIATLQNILILNINEVANSVKTLLLPGEKFTVQVVQPGKESDQGLAYLDDGTMIVVENGIQFLNTSIKIVVSRVIQTTTGKIIFAKLP